MSKVCWAHPEFGSIIASASFDRTVKIWEQTPAGVDEERQQSTGATNGSTQQQQQQQSSTGPSSSRWIERAVLADAKGTVRGVEFAPHHFGLKLASLPALALCFPG